jgi:hypothetical protein
LGFTGGLANVPLRAAYQAAIPADARGNGMAVSNFFIYLFTTLLSILLFLLARSGILKNPLEQLVFLGFLCGTAALAAAWIWRRQVGELLRDNILPRKPDRSPLPQESNAPTS